MRVVLAFASLSVLAACVAPSAPPPAPARPVLVPAPAPAPAPPPPANSDWRDWPLTPGDWNYMRNQNGSGAAYTTAHHGTLFLMMQCERANGGQIVLTRVGARAGTVTVRTSSTARTLTTRAVEGGASATLPANDPLVDAMGYSRGRFIVETPGMPPLVVPAWAEVLRVAEDCRG